MKLHPTSTSVSTSVGSIQFHYLGFNIIRLDWSNLPWNQN